MTGTVYVDSHGRTDTGKKRPTNEDALLIAGLGKTLNVQQTNLLIEDQSSLESEMQGQLFVVADGLGGLPAGGRASSLAVYSVASYVLNTMDWFFDLDEGRGDALATQLSEALMTSRATLEADTTRHPDHGAMGTTLTMAYLRWPSLYVVHAGDSRCYLLRGGWLHQLTRDHTVAERLMEEGVLNADEIRKSYLTEMVWNIISADRRVDLAPEVYEEKLQGGDVLLLCTDGLNKHVSDHEITRILTSKRSAERGTRELIEAANRGGGSDNTTVIVARFREAGDDIA